MAIATRKKGIVYLVGIAAKLETTTSTSEHIAAMIRPNAAPFHNTAAIVSGKNTAVMHMIVIPTQPM